MLRAYLISLYLVIGHLVLSTYYALSPSLSMYLLTCHIFIAFSIIYLFFLYIFCLSSLSTDLSPSIILCRDSLAVTKVSKQTVRKVRVKEAGAEACGWAAAVSTGHDDVSIPVCSLDASIEEELTAMSFKLFTLAFL